MEGEKVLEGNPKSNLEKCGGFAFKRVEMYDKNPKK